MGRKDSHYSGSGHSTNLPRAYQYRKSSSELLMTKEQLNLHHETQAMRT